MRRTEERGSALLLVPAAVLVLVVLGAIAVDSAVVLLAGRELSSAAAAAANDGVTIGMDDSAFYNHGTVTVAGDRAAVAARASIASRDIHGLDLGPTTVRVEGDELTVEVEAQVPLLFARAIPGVRHRVTVHARSTARAQEREG